MVFSAAASRYLKKKISTNFDSKVFSVKRPLKMLSNGIKIMSVALTEPEILQICPRSNCDNSVRNEFTVMVSIGRYSMMYVVCYTQLASWRPAGLPISIIFSK